MKFKRKFEKNASEFLHFSESPSQSLLVLSKALEEALAGWIGEQESRGAAWVLFASKE